MKWTPNNVDLKILRNLRYIIRSNQFICRIEVLKWFFNVIWSIVILAIFQEIYSTILILLPIFYLLQLRNFKLAQVNYLSKNKYKIKLRTFVSIVNRNWILDRKGDRILNQKVFFLFSICRIINLYNISIQI